MIDGDAAAAATRGASGVLSGRTAIPVLIGSGMVPRTIFHLVVGVWLLAAVVVVGYPLRSGQIRVGLDPVSRNTAPRAFWTAYIISTVSFLAVSVAVGFFVRSILS
jgi:hypothetical protein